MFKAVASKAAEPTCSIRRHGLPILAETAGLKGIKPHVQRPTIQHSPPPISQLFTFTFSPAYYQVLSCPAVVVDMMRMTNDGTRQVQLNDDNNSLKGSHLRLRLLEVPPLDLDRGTRMILTLSPRPAGTTDDEEASLATPVQPSPDHRINRGPGRGRGQTMDGTRYLRLIETSHKSAGGEPVLPSLWSLNRGSLQDEGRTERYPVTATTKMKRTPMRSSGRIELWRIGEDVMRKSKPKREEIEKRMKRIDIPDQIGTAVERLPGDPTMMMIAIDLEIGDVIKKSYEIQTEQLGCRQKKEGIERFVSIPLRTLDTSLTTQEPTTRRRRTSRERERDRRREDSEDWRRGHKGRSSGDTRRSDRRRSDPPSSGSVIDRLFDKGVKIVKDTFGGDEGR